MDAPSDPTLYYVGLESYASRYTYQLTEWNRRVLGNRYRSHNVEYVSPLGNDDRLDSKGAIVAGQVLDSVGRPYYAMQQIAALLVVLKTKGFGEDDAIFFEDMFHPGIESLFYAFDQLPRTQQPRVYLRCLAQTIDPDDFVHVTGMTKWMRRYEQMVLESNQVTGIIAASQDMLMHLQIAQLLGNTEFYVSGLPFGKAEVVERGERLNLFPSWDDRKQQVVFAARTDQEKQPLFFVELALAYQNLAKEQGLPAVDFVILAGKELTSNSSLQLDDLKDAIADGVIQFKGNLTKDEYYTELGTSRVLFNCALQDWVSNTVSEADTLGTNVLYPAYRSFIEVFQSDATRLYVPWSIQDALAKLLPLLRGPSPNMSCISGYQDGSIKRTFDYVLGYDQCMLVPNGATAYLDYAYMRPIDVEASFSIPSTNTR